MRWCLIIFAGVVLGVALFLTLYSDFLGVKPVVRDFVGLDDAKGIVRLPNPSHDGVLSVEKAIYSRRSVRKYADKPLSLDDVGQILWSMQGVTNWVGFRAAPSAGGTYPLEVYLLADDVEGLSRGLYNYRPSDHSLIHVKSGDALLNAAKSTVQYDMISSAPAALLICANYSRTLEKYGERGVRYVHMEAGHVGQNLYLQAESLGIGTVSVGAFNDEIMKEELGIHEEPLIIYPIGYN